MAALNSPRNTPRKGNEPVLSVLALPVKAGVKIHQGALVVIDAGYAKPALTGTNLIAAGRAMTTADNTSGNSGNLTVEVETGVFRWDNSAGGDQIAQADVGTDCYVVDDHTVAKTNGTNTRSKAGVVIGVDAAGVWVATRLG